MKNTTNTVRIISEIGIIAALGFVFDELQGILSKSIFINGGSIGFAMIAVLIMAYRRGLIPALATGLIMGLLDIATSAYILHPAQLLLDYIFPYALVGVVGFLKPLYDKSKDKPSKILWLISGAVIGGLLKFLSHYLAGVIFWADATNFAWNLNEMNPYLYCFIYNIAFMGPCIILSGALLVAIQLTAPRIFEVKNSSLVEAEEKKSYLPMAISITTIVAGLFLFVFFLIRYILSFSDYVDDYNAYGYDFDPDSMLIFVLGFFLAILGVNSLIKSVLNKFSYPIYFGVLSSITLASFIYGLSRLIRCYVKGKNPSLYWLWFGIGLATLTIVVFLFVYLLVKNKKEKASNI